jgi:DNA topoisomerase VI subunit A
MQPLTERDRSRARGLLAHPWVKTRAAWRDELQRQLDLGEKCEIEALHYGNRIDAVADFIETAITRRDFLD